MTISSSTSKNQYTSVGETTFTYTFKIFDDSDIRVLVDGVVQTITTDYTVTGAGNSAGGTIIFNVATTSGEIITIKRNEPLTQKIDYVEGDDFPAAAHEEGLDRSAIRDQFLQEQIDRSITFAEDSTTTGVVFPEPEADLFIAWNAAGTQLENTAGIEGPAGPTGPAGADGEVAGPVSSVDSEIALFDGVTGKVIKSATGTGFAKVVSGVLQTPVATIGTSEIADDAITGDKLNDTGVAAATYTNMSATVDLQGRIISAASGAGDIEAVSLAQDGYVHFSNGLLIQWGDDGAMAQDATKTITYPIAFDTVYMANLTSRFNSFSLSSLSVRTLGTSTLLAQNAGTAITSTYWIAIGQKSV